MQIKPLGKILILILIVGIAIGVFKSWNKLAPAAATKPSVVPHNVSLPDAGQSPNSSGGTATATNAGFTQTGSNPGCADKPEVRLLGYAWNAQMGLLLANGGAQAAQGSLMCRHGVNLKWARQDDNGKMQEALVAFATQLSQGNPNPDKGAHFVTIMGDGAAAFLQGLNTTLRRIGPAYQAKIVDAVGYSRGEDKLMGPPSWKSNPQASAGSLVAGVIRDGDWNIAQKWLGDNGLRTNPDEKTYDPDAMNWVNASDYIDAAQKYVAGYAEDRPVVRNGKRTGETKHITVNGCVTWTPGDVTVAEKKGGLVSIVSTREYTSQMPCVVIGIDKWMKQNRSTVENFIQAVGEAGDQVKSNPVALHQASQISAQLYNEPGADAAYWEKYFKGVQQQDKTGQSVDLGGSSVNNLADSLFAFGLVQGGANLVAATYTVFGDLAKSQYPELVATYPPADQVIDASYLQDLAKRSVPSKAVITQAKPKYVKRTANAPVLSRRAWRIHFDAGKAAFSPDAKRLLDQLSRELLIAGGTTIEIHGHTDSQGNPVTSKPLSEARAFAVEKYLEKRAPANFPKGRIQVFAHGQDNPVAPNATAEGRALNRRVEIVLRSAG